MKGVIIGGIPIASKDDVIQLFESCGKIEKVKVNLF
jgi:hypothetical protein